MPKTIKGGFKQEMMFGRVAKIPIANTSDELAEMDFANYGDFAAFLRIQGDFVSLFSAIISMGAQKKEAHAAEMVRGKVVPNWLAVFGAPGIIVADKDSEFIGGDLQEFCAARNIVAQTVIPGHHQSLVATGRRRGHLRTIIHHMIGSKKPNSSGRKEWGGEFAAMTMMRLNSQVQQFDGFTHGQ